MNHGSFYSNIVEVPDRWQFPFHTSDDTYGVYLENCPNFVVEDNEFYALTINNLNGRAGVVVSDCGQLSNQIYLNYFNGFGWAGIMAQGVNDGPATDDGLKFFCNTFEDQLHDELLVVGTNAGNSNGVVSLYQGDCFTEIPARNRFITDVCVSGNFTIDKDQNSHPQVMNYAYHGSSASLTEPQCHTPNYVFTDPCALTLNFTTECPSRFNTGTPGAADLRSMVVNYSVSIENYNALFDGNNTDWLMDQIYERNLDTSVVDTFIIYSPWISEKVLLNLVNTAENLDYQKVKYILELNSRLPLNVWETIRLLDNETTFNLLEDLDTLQSINNPTDSIRMLLTQDLLNLEWAYTNLGSIYLSDSTFEEDGFDSLLYMNTGRNHFEHLNLICAVKLKLKDFETAGEVLEEMHDTHVDDDYCDLLGLYIDLLQETDGIYSLKGDSVSESDVRSYLSSTGRSPALAKAILRKVFNEYFPEYLYEVGAQEERNAVHVQAEEPSAIEANSEISVRPNPSNGKFEVHSVYGNPIDRLVIFDLTGRLLLEKKLETEQAYSIIDVSNVPTGIYLLKVRLGDTEQMVKISIISR